MLAWTIYLFTPWVVDASLFTHPPFELTFSEPPI